MTDRLIVDSKAVAIQVWIPALEKWVYLDGGGSFEHENLFCFSPGKRALDTPNTTTTRMRVGLPVGGKAPVYLRVVIPLIDESVVDELVFFPPAFISPVLLKLHWTFPGCEGGRFNLMFSRAGPGRLMLHSVTWSVPVALQP